jgi:hypothetical protein
VFGKKKEVKSQYFFYGQSYETSDSLNTEVCIVTGLRTERRRNRATIFGMGKKRLLFYKASLPTQSPMQWLTKLLPRW